MPIKTIKLPVEDQSLLATALTHRSYLNEHKQIKEHNERLEFLGDAVLELAVSEFLYAKYPLKPEGELTAYRAALVRTTTLAEASLDLGLGQRLMLSKGEEASGGRDNPSLLANTFEAVIGALYLDKDFQAVVSFLEEALFPKIDKIIELKLFKDFKSSLQELVQADGHDSPIYEVVKENGPDHEKEFHVVVKVSGNIQGKGLGKSKQAAQQAAARSALEKMRSA